MPALLPLPRLVFGAGSISTLAKELAAFGVNRPLLVSDRGLERAGIAGLAAKTMPPSAAFLDTKRAVGRRFGTHHNTGMRRRHPHLTLTIFHFIPKTNAAKTKFPTSTKARHAIRAISLGSAGSSGSAASPTFALVVEDELVLRLRAVDIVEDAGFTAIEAVNADEALSILESRSDISLLFTDIQMPGSIDGLMLAHTVHKRWPAIKIILVSGQVKLSEADKPADSRSSVSRSR